MRGREGAYRVQNAQPGRGTPLVQHVAGTFDLVYGFALGLVIGGSSADDGLEIVRVRGESEEPEVMWTYSPDDEAFAADAELMRKLMPPARPELN